MGPYLVELEFRGRSLINFWQEMAVIVFEAEVGEVGWRPLVIPGGREMNKPTR